MTRNTKIALGCGGAGCLGLILLVIVCVVLVVTGVVRAPGLYNANRNDNYNSNSNSNDNSNSNSNTNDNLNTNSDSSSSSSSMSEDDKHKLFQAAGLTKDNPLILRVLKKIGFPNGTGEGYSEFVKDHFSWAMKNLEFIQSVNTPEKARAYVDEHIDD
jgi:predicted metalloprotease